MSEYSVVVVMLKLDFLRNQPPFCQNRLFTGYRNVIITKKYYY